MSEHETIVYPPHMYKAIHTEYFPASYTLIAKDGDGNKVKYRRTNAKVECDHYSAAVGLITKHWTNSPEVLNLVTHQIVGGWLKPGVYVWVIRRRGG